MPDPRPDRLGVCFDIDGTLYRHGSVFVEVLAALAVRSSALDEQARARLREAVGLVGEFHGSNFTRWRWQQTLNGLERLHQRTDSRTVDDVLDFLQRLRTRLAERNLTADGRVDPDARARFQRQLLGTYGQAISGLERASVSAAIRDALRTRQPIDTQTDDALAQLTSAGADIALVTDMPAHVAAAFADVVVQAPISDARGTQFETDDADVFTGSYDRICKGDVVETLSAEHGWDTVVAAGDTDRDAAMAPHADVFLAVTGHGGVQQALRTHSPGGAVYSIPSDQPLGPALTDYLQSQ